MVEGNVTSKLREGKFQYILSRTVKWKHLQENVFI